MDKRASTENLFARFITDTSSNFFNHEEPFNILVGIFMFTNRSAMALLFSILIILSRNMTQALKLSYTANADSTWYLGSGIYTESEM